MIQLAFIAQMVAISGLTAAAMNKNKIGIAVFGVLAVIGTAIVTLNLQVA
jgi:hypothetical protein